VRALKAGETAQQLHSIFQQFKINVQRNKRFLTVHVH